MLLACAPIDQPVAPLCLQTPIGNPKLLQHLQPHQLFTPNDALEMATARIHSQPAWSTTRDGHAMNVGAVLDLTNSKRYYDPADFTSRGVYHIKVWHVIYVGL